MMKIRAIRVAEIGQFSNPVAIEGLTGGLDVLAGPNELGKSTIFHALRLALFAKYTSKQADIVELRPYGGGNPTVEVDFECGGGIWRVRKRFLGQPLAELKGLETPQLWRGPDVEAQLLRLLSGKTGVADGSGRFGLLWVAQQEALRAGTPKDTEQFAGARDDVERALASEVMAMTQGARAKRVKASLQEKLSELVTATGRPKAHGPWDVALRTVDHLRREVAEVERALSLARDNLNRLGDLREQEKALAQPSAAHGRQAALEAARTAVEVARDALTHRDLAEAALKAAESELLRRREENDRFLSVRRELTDLETRSHADRAELSATELKLQTLSREFEQATTHLHMARDVLDRLGVEHAASMAADRRQAQLVRVHELEQRCQAAEQSISEGRALRAEIAGFTATPALLAAAQREHAEINNLQIRLEATQPTLTVNYFTNAMGRLRVDGRAVEDGDVLRPNSRTVVEIEGIGELVIDPGDAQSLEDIAADLDAHRQQFQSVLARTGAVDLEALSALVERRQLIEARIAELTATVRALAPAGIERLNDELQSLRTMLPDAPEAAGYRAIATLEGEIREQRKSIAGHEASVERLQAQISSAQTIIARLSAQSEEAHRKRNQLLAALPPSEIWDQRQRDLAAAMAAAESAANSARRELTAWAEMAPTAEAQRKLAADVTVAEAAIRDAERRLFELGTEAARIDGELASARNEDIESRFAMLSADLERAETNLETIADDVAAMRLLEAELQIESGLARNQYLVPVLSRLRPLVHQVLPNAEVELGAAFAPGSLARGGGAEPLKRLSDGTKEQLAVLTRLAIARLFSQSGQGIPVILDDPLVYADDDRIESMFDVLRQSAEMHQVIVLTCRTLAFDRLGGTRLAMRPWQPDAVRS